MCMQCYIDDILVTGRNNDEHIANLEEVMKRLQSHGVKINRKKCSFLQDSVEYLGHRIDKGFAYDIKQDRSYPECTPTQKQEAVAFLLRASPVLLKVHFKSVHTSVSVEPAFAPRRQVGVDY